MMLVPKSSSRTMRRSITLVLLLRQLLLNKLVGATEGNTQKDILCSGGTCPTPPGAQHDVFPPDDCGLWLGPSPIKENEEHGFGLGVFTGRAIPEGASVDVPELIIPLFDSTLHRENHHPPLREYVWDGDNFPDVPFESRRGTFLFLPGMAAIAACTSKNYNTALTATGTAAYPDRYNAVEDNSGIHRSRDASAGSFSYRNNVTYTAIRDIVVGEELTVDCDDDDYDGGAYFLSTFSSTDNAVVCVDNNLYVDGSTVPGAGKGVFSKKSISKGGVLTSTPVVPIHRSEMNILGDNVNGDKSADLPQHQLLLNYCYGHPRSDLLLLPYGPLVNYINHVPDTKPANAIIRWHPTTVNDNDKLPRRQQHHHPELLEMSGTQVAKVHGKGLMMDIIALRDIDPNEEIFLDYGPEWKEAWRSHVESFKRNKPEDADYISASDYMRNADTTVIRTVSEQEKNPYPDNLQTVCFYDAADKVDDDEEVEEEESTVVSYTSSWNADVDIHSCLRPCIILDRYQVEVGNADKEERYKAKMLPMDSSSDVVVEGCELLEEHHIIVTEIIPSAVRIADRPYTSDLFLKMAFRHEIGVPDDFYPKPWKKKQLRSTKKTEDDDENDDSFKRKGRTKTK